MIRHEQGYVCITDNETGKVLEECSTFRCNHCQYIVHVRHKASPYELGGLCRACNKLICARCVDKATCQTVEAWLEREEEKYHRRKEYGLL